MFQLLAVQEVSKGIEQFNTRAFGWHEPAGQFLKVASRRPPVVMTKPLNDTFSSYKSKTLPITEAAPSGTR